MIYFWVLNQQPGLQTLCIQQASLFDTYSAEKIFPQNDILRQKRHYKSIRITEEWQQDVPIMLLGKYEYYYSNPDIW